MNKFTAHWLSGAAMVLALGMGNANAGNEGLNSSSTHAPARPPTQNERPRNCVQYEDNTVTCEYCFESEYLAKSYCFEITGGIPNTSYVVKGGHRR